MSEDWKEMDYNPLDFIEEEPSTDEYVDETIIDVTKGVSPAILGEPEPERDVIRDVVLGINKPPEPKKQEGPSMNDIFHKYLPDTLYYSHYELTKLFGFTPQEWRTFIRDNHLFIETELAAIAEAEARSALARLGNASGQEVTALKAILEKSKMINDAQRQATKIIMTFITPTNRNPKKEEVTE